MEQFIAFWSLSCDCQGNTSDTQVTSACQPLISERGHTWAEAVVHRASGGMDEPGGPPQELRARLGGWWVRARRRCPGQGGLYHGHSQVSREAGTSRQTQQHGQSGEVRGAVEEAAEGWGPAPSCMLCVLPPHPGLQVPAESGSRMLPGCEHLSLAGCQGLRLCLSSARTRCDQNIWRMFKLKKLIVKDTLLLMPLMILPLT